MNGTTGTATTTTPGGSVTASFDLTQTSTGTRNGQANVTENQGTVTSSTDPAIPNGGTTDYQTYSSVTALQYSEYGTWDLAPNSSGNSVYVGVLAGGQPGVPQTASMPTTGSATYSGGATGYIVQPNSSNSTGTAGGFFGNASLTANFASGGVTGSISGIQAYSVQNNGVGGNAIGSVNDISLSANISGAQYTGTASASGSAGAAFDISGATGSLKGAFYGPSAAETAGVFYLTGGTNGVSVMGAFGAKQPPASDRRLKTDVETVGVLPNGLKLYSWRYLGGSRRHTGVMAQDVLADHRFAAAALIDADGLMRVDYARLGYVPDDMAAMVAEGEAAIALYRATVH
ncbi:MAG TPA: transferrin-binding protein-like solute binding protein [Caulobacteraceae bacterium]|nr:transferrin-binding protein-like solute binding protein [Caulobacteraceae bacterium]